MENPHGKHDDDDDQIHDDLSLMSASFHNIAGSNGFGHRMEFMSQPYLIRNRSSEIDIQIHDDNSNSTNQDRPLPIFLKFEEVEYKVRIRKGSQPKESSGSHRQILKGITGSVGPGEILALMGPSGSGKTTLLKVIGGRLHQNVKGTITYNDIPYNPALKRRIGFVTQDDVLFPNLTVEETLIFSAFLRLPSSMSRRQKHERVEMIIKELGLERCRGTRVGGGFVKGISGGERKRTSIGYEILVDPSLLLLDEPTSGLDSTSANTLLLVLQRLAQLSSGSGLIEDCNGNRNNCELVSIGVRSGVAQQWCRNQGSGSKELRVIIVCVNFLIQHSSQQKSGAADWSGTVWELLQRAGDWAISLRLGIDFGLWKQFNWN
ncbi:ABC transporter G member 26 [Sarracenia purpurea var. burkii]